MLSCRFSCLYWEFWDRYREGGGEGILRDRLYCMYALIRPLSTCDVDMDVVDIA